MPGAAEYVGATPEQLHGTGWAEALHPDDRQRVRDAWEIACRAGTEHRVEVRIRGAKTGEYRWFHVHALPQRDADGQVVRWFGTCTDIDDRKRAEDGTARVGGAVAGRVPARGRRPGRRAPAHRASSTMKSARS